MVLVDYDYYDTLMAQLEDLSDLASLRAADDEPSRPYDEFLAELGAPADAPPGANESTET